MMESAQALTLQAQRFNQHGLSWVYLYLSVIFASVLYSSHVRSKLHSLVPSMLFPYPNPE
jgi:hypothetical protein